MRKLPNNAFEKAKKYIKMKARGLERSHFEFLFENGSRENVINELKKYQNEDGGFGHGIEPDFWLPLSSPMATWVAGQILLEIAATKDEPMVTSMITYLTNTIDERTGMWRSALPENNEYPHAPWWHWYEGVQKSWMFNPSAELAAFLVHWSTAQSKAAEIGWAAIAKAVERLMTANEMAKHEINNYQQLVKIMMPRESTFNATIQYSLLNVSQQVNKLAENCVDKNVLAWAEGYKPLPLDFIDHPLHPLCERLAPLVEDNLQFYIEQLSDDGIWDISWSWDRYPEEFEIARENWKGILAITRYKQLKAFGYLN